MAEILEVLPDFPGFAVKYDTSKKPFFRPTVVETLRKLKEVAAGKALLSAIAAATPAVRGDFPVSINVICVPTSIEFTQSGYKRDGFYGDGGVYTPTGMSPSPNPNFAPVGCPFWLAGGSSNNSIDKTAATNTLGSVCYMNFTNAQIMTRKGEPSAAYIVLAHELIHSLHSLQGITMDGKGEELWTTGIGEYADNPMSENAFRRQFGLPLRNAYF